MKELYHGCKVKYNGYKTTKDGHTVDAICTATVIGWDEHTIYTDFIRAGADAGDCFYSDPETITSEMVTIDWRLGFHRSRLIDIVEDINITINHNVTQQSLF